jgi:hypothetical protein
MHLAERSKQITNKVVKVVGLSNFCIILLHGTKGFKLTLNLDKTYTIKSIKKNSPKYALSIGYVEKCIEESVNTKFLGLQIDNQLNWKNHIVQMIPKLTLNCYSTA